MSRKLNNISGAGCSVLFAVIGLALAGSMSFAKAADEKTTRDRKVRVAIAIAEAEADVKSQELANGTGTGAKPAIAPSPRPITPKDYAIGRKEALLDQQPLVVYVACDGPKVDGAITCFVPAPTFGEVTGPAIVVGYPAGDRLLIEKTLPCPAPDGALKKAVENAAKKIENNPPKQMPASPTANYRIDAAGGHGGKSATACICGDACKCKEGDCPAKCPVATTPPASATPPASVASSVSQPACVVEYFYGSDGRLYQRTKCPLKQ